MSEIKNTESVYSVSAKTTRCMDMLKKLVAIQGEVINFVMEEGYDNSANDIAEPIGDAVKMLGSIINEQIYENLIAGKEVI